MHANKRIHKNTYLNGGLWERKKEEVGKEGGKEVKNSGQAKNFCSNCREGGFMGSKLRAICSLFVMMRERLNEFNTEESREEGEEKLISNISEPLYPVLSKAMFIPHLPK